MFDVLKGLLAATESFHDKVLRGQVNTLGDLNDIEEAMQIAKEALAKEPKFGAGDQAVYDLLTK